MNILNKIDQYLTEGKLTFFEMTKLKYFARSSVIDLLNSYDFRKKRVVFEKNRVGGTQKDVRLFIKILIKNDLDSTKELGFSLTKDQISDHKYLKSI